LLAAVLVSTTLAAIGLVPQSGPPTRAAGECSPYYPDFCIPNPPPDINCSDVAQRNFHAYPPDPHGLDVDKDNIGCEDPAAPLFSSALKIRAYLPATGCDDCHVASPPPGTATTSPTQATATATATPTKTAAQAPTATPTVGGCSAATATITGLNKSGSPETVSISGSGLLTGWYLISTAGNQRFDFPVGYVLSGSVTITSGSGAAANPPAVLLWTTSNIWNNSSNDDAVLYDCIGIQRSFFDDGQ
jgi:hypothetical protein